MVVAGLGCVSNLQSPNVSNDADLVRDEVLEHNHSRMHQAVREDGKCSSFPQEAR